MSHSHLNILLVASFLLLFWQSEANAESADSYSNKIYKAYISDNMELWKSTMEKMEDESGRDKSEKLLLHLTLAQYGYTGYLIGKDKDKEAEELLTKTRHNATQLKNSRYKAEAYAILAGLNGYQIGLAKHKAPFLGKKSQNLTDKSLEITKINPLGWMERGNIYYHMPGFFGGSYKKAINNYSNALIYFDETPYLPLWLKLNALVWLGKAYEADGQLKKAAQTYRKALKIEPNFNWVKNDLYPALKKKM